MSEWNTERLIAADKKVVWHPFTNIRDWGAADHEPLVLVEGRGAILRDSRGREYIDGKLETRSAAPLRKRAWKFL